MDHRIISFLEQNCPGYRDMTFLLAVSGGLDSMCLLHSFHKGGLKFEVAHCNFRLRDQESDEDEEFVRQSAHSLGVTFHCERFNTKEHAAKSGISTQMAARELRYTWFRQIVEQRGLNLICTAHHLNDSVETALFNFVKGSGLAGIAGIPAHAENVIRPMIDVSREELVRHADSEGIKWREDSSNASTDYMRNFIRIEIIPLLREINPSFPENHSSTMKRLQMARRFLDKQASRKMLEVVRIDGDTQYFHLDKVEEADVEYLLIHWLTPAGYNFSQVEQIRADLKNAPGAEYHSATHLLVRDRKSLILEPKGDQSEIHLEIEHSKGELIFGDQTLRIEVVDKDGWKVDLDPRYVQLDLASLEFPLKVRTWQEGDHFIPLGMKGKKKISDFMIDRKIPINFKRRVPLLISGEKVAAVLGLAIDDRFKVTERTKKVYIIRIDHA